MALTNLLLSKYTVHSEISMKLLNMIDWDADGSHDVIGEVQLTLREVTAGNWFTTAIRQNGR